MEELTTKIGDAKLSVYYSEKGFPLKNIWSELTHFHAYHEIHIILDGEATVEINGKPVIVKKGDTLVLCPKVSHYTVKSTENILRFGFLFDLSESDERKLKTERFSEYNYYCNILKSIKGCIIIRTHEIVEAVERIRNVGDSIEKQHITKILYSLLFTEILEEIRKSVDGKVICGKQNKEIKYDDKDYKIPAEEFFYNRYKERVTINDLAKSLYLSVSQTARVVRRVFGMSFKEVLLKQRMENAVMQIGKGNLSLDEIAADSGYNSYNGFFSAFKKYTGYTPEEYKKKNF
ncbi:MAG: helix-turn-helix domain-containing protein [Clostridia bacterium]|nr:helix-turn-helix domain-containing protein [Clostridia bacterium]